LKKAPLDRRDCLFRHTGDEVISAYLRRLDPLCLVLIGAFDFSEGLVGLAEARPIAGMEYVEIGYRWRGLSAARPWGYLIARALYSHSACGREFNFRPSNLALVRPV
jgi:hypothetical protein